MIEWLRKSSAAFPGLILSVRSSYRERLTALETDRMAPILVSKQITENRSKADPKFFLEELPSYLLAVASGLRVGLSPLVALERSARLLSPQSPLRDEITLLLQQLHRGEPKEETIERFAQHMPLVELTLFRSALLINWEHGGQLGRTLTQISQSTRERQALIASARITTTVMNMTANVLIVLTPILLLVVASRYTNFLELIMSNAASRTAALLGGAMILGGLITLKRMCNFTP